MSHSASSYEFDAFQEADKAKEVARLKSKASILFQIDRKNWQQAKLRECL
jgi:hypothetical protein